MKTSKKIISLIAGTGLLTASFLNAATTDPVGYVTLTVKGTTGDASEAYSFISPSLQNAVSSTGTVESVDGTLITASSAAWTADAFQSKYFIEITSGTNTGAIATIQSNTESALTTVEDLSSLLSGGETFNIRRYLTINDLFGADNSAGLTSSSSLGTSDEILLPNGAGDFDRYFYYNNPRGTDGWRSSVDVVNDAGETPIPIGQGVIVRRKSADDLSVVLSGSVVVNAQVLYPIETGFNFVSSAYPVTYTLNSFFGPDGGSLKSSSQFSSADQVLVQNASGDFDYYFYWNNPRGASGWRKSTDVVNDAGDVVIMSAGNAVIVDRQEAPFNFAESRPF